MSLDLMNFSPVPLHKVLLPNGEHSIGRIDGEWLYEQECKINDDPGYIWEDTGRVFKVAECRELF